MTKEDLLKAAARARAAAYAPYSGYLVGAALLAKDGGVYVGCNVENASYGLTICAERAAVFAAVAAGRREFSMLALSLGGGGAPCGACRQVLSEFAPELPVVVGDGDGAPFREFALNQLLPEAFGPGNL